MTYINSYRFSSMSLINDFWPTNDPPLNNLTLLLNDTLIILQITSARLKILSENRKLNFLVLYCNVSSVESSLFLLLLLRSNWINYLQKYDFNRICNALQTRNSTPMSSAEIFGNRQWFYVKSSLKTEVDLVINWMKDALLERLIDLSIDWLGIE